MDDQEDLSKPIESMEVNSSSDSSSSEDDEADQALTAKAEELERQLSDNKYLYGAHEELISVYRQLGDLTSLRQAYERFHEHFPLTSEIWMGWIGIEKQLATTGEEMKNVCSLFHKSVEDYMSVKLWLEYVQYSIGANDLETTRQIIEKGLTSVGLHTADGSLLWDTFRELELAHLSLVDEGSEQWKEQLLKVVEIFRRQLSVPLVGMEKTYQEWKTMLEQLPEGHGVNPEPIEWGYKKALKTLHILKPFEDNLQVTTEEGNLLKIYRDYVKAITDPNTILCVYERAVSQMCLNVNIWLDYCLYALKLGAPADKVSGRALRNCPWSEDLWSVRLRVLESLNKDEKEVITCFEQGISNLGSNQEVELWLTYLEYVSRNNKDKLFKTFEQALEHLQYVTEGSTKVTKWYARLLAKNGDIVGARRQWKIMLKNPENKACANIWLEYGNLERQYGDPNQLRNLYQRALTSCTDWPQYIAEEWLMFERESGTLNDVIKCIEKRNELLKTETQPAKPEEVPQKTNKRKLEEDTKPENKKPKFEKVSPKKAPIVKDPTTTVFVSNLHTTVNEKRLKKMFPNSVNLEIVLDRQGKSKCYGYVQFNMEEEVMTALARDRELLDGRPIFISACKTNRTERKAGFKYSLESESNKLFVKGLPADKNEDDVKEIFKDYGAKAVRLVRRRDGQPKGLAYVEFEDDASAKKAMSKTDQMQIGEHTITVVISAPPPKKPNLPKAAGPSMHAKRKLQMPLIPRALQVKGESNGEAKPLAKSNEDFRNMLFNK